MDRKRIIIEVPIETLSTEEQDKVFILSRTNNVFCRDVNGELWQVLDMTGPECTEIIRTTLKGD